MSVIDQGEGYKVELTEKEYKDIVDFVYGHCGISLGTNKKELVKARLMKRLRFHGFKSYSAYLDYLKKTNSEDELTELLNAISTNVTYFFREPQHFDFMDKHAIPFLLHNKRQVGDRRLRIWSSAASTGEEASSIIMNLSESMPDINAWDVRILGTDISTKALKVAHEGVYTKDKLKNLPLGYKEKYFTQLKNDPNSYQLKSSLREKLVFRRLNLMLETFPFKNKFDIIFCRNVMIYFDRPTQERLVRKFYRYLAPKGFLFIGHSESLIGADVSFKRVATAIFQRD